MNSQLVVVPVSVLKLSLLFYSFQVAASPLVPLLLHDLKENAFAPGSLEDNHKQFRTYQRGFLQLSKATSSRSPSPSSFIQSLFPGVATSRNTSFGFIPNTARTTPIFTETGSQHTVRRHRPVHDHVPGEVFPFTVYCILKLGTFFLA